MKTLFVSMFWMTCWLTANGQSLLIEGRLTDGYTGEAIPYAAIGIEGTSVGTSSNLEGFFSLRVPPGLKDKKFSLKISCVGYENVVIKNQESHLDVRMKQSTTLLKDIVVFGKDLSPDGIVRRAFSNIKKNYETRPFVYQTFYRHYCKDDSVYGRLIEAAVDVYKTKGYKAQQPSPGLKDQVRVNQLRRSIDNTRVASGHMPIALYSIMGADPVGYQVRSASSFMLGLLNQYEVSSLKKYFRNFQFSLDGITEYDGEQVYKINYHLKRDSTQLSTGLVFRSGQSGTLFITTGTYAFVKSEFTRTSAAETVNTFSIYKKVNNKYYLHHSMKDGRTLQMRDKFVHNFHIELITTDILDKNKFTPFKGKQPGREELFAIEYDSTFWNSYNILEATPLEESIVADLERDHSLKSQYSDFMTSEREKYFSGKEDEEKFIKFLEANKGYRPVYIDFWASWCGPCLKEMPRSMELVDKYRGKVAFVYLSLDDDIEAWKKALNKYNINKPFITHHFRIGPQADATNLFSVNSIPRYVLVDRNGNFVNLNAPRPGDDAIETELDRLLAEPIEK